MRERESFRFVGTACTIGDTRLEYLGARVDLAPGDAAEAVSGGAALLPAAVFEQIFSRDDVARYASPGSRVAAPDDFQAKMRDAWGRVHAWRESGMMPTTEEVG